MTKRTLHLPALIAAAALLSCALALLADSQKAEATFPGQNGRIAFSGGSGWWSDDNNLYDIYTVEPDGTDLSRLTPDPPYDEASRVDHFPAYSPDGQKIAFQRGGDIHIMASDGSGLERITGPGFSSGFAPVAWSPDGTRIALTGHGDGQIYTVRPDGTNLRRLTDDLTAAYYVSWSPDGTKIAFSERRPGDRGWDNGSDIHVVDADGSNERTITDASTGHYHLWFDWSPDSEKIAFSGTYDEEAMENGEEGPFPHGIYVADADGLNVKQVYNGGGFPVTWSPDGGKIAFTISGDWGSAGVYVMGTDGSDVARVVGDIPGLDDSRNLDWQSLGNPGTNPPETTIIAAPPALAGPSAAFDFVSSTPGSTFECSLDGAAFAPCEGPKEYAGLPAGEHEFRVRAKGPGGEVDPTPAGRTWAVEAPEPADGTGPTITAPQPVPDSSTRDRTPTIKATVRDAESELAASDIRLYVDGDRKTFSYNPDTDRLSRTTGRLSFGRHAVRIEAEDAAGNAVQRAWSFRVVRGR